MGGLLSEPTAPPPPPPTLLETPWRHIEWGNTKESLQWVNNYKPSNKDQQLRILIHGQAGAGKSSFINSVQSVLRGRMYRQALADNTSGGSFTKKSRTYKIQRECPDAFYPFVFADKDTGVLLQEILEESSQGRVKENDKFNPESEGDDFYNKAPTDNDEVHVLVCVAAADTLSTMSEEVQKKIKEIRAGASLKDIPQIAILTKVDAACPEVKEDLRKVYRSKDLKEMMEKFSEDTGIPMGYIFLVKNYHDEIDLIDDINTLILSIFKHIIYCGDDFINMKLQNMNLCG